MGVALLTEEPDARVKVCFSKGVGGVRADIGNHAAVLD
jgi:hypothetical protein